MADVASSTADIHTQPNCIFCKIRSKEVPSNILYEDEKFCVFPDHKPAATHHFIVIPKNHIRDLKAMKKEDIDMVKEMQRIGLDVLRKESGETEPQAVTGFHWPIHSVSHLHMHIISPQPQGFLPKIVYGSWFFGSTQQAIELLEKK